MSLHRIALGTAAISFVGIFRVLAQFFVVPVLSRLLSPADYGVVAMAMPFVIFTMIFSDAGVGQSLVRTSQKGDRDMWSTSFWLTLAAGAGLALVIIGFAPLATAFFNEPRLLAIISALALAIIPQAAATIPEASLRQNHRFGVIAMTEMASILAGVAAAVTVALNGGGAWALVAQQVTLYTVRFVSTFLLSSFRPQLVFSLRGIREHLVFGRDVLSAKFVWFITGAMDGPIIGKVLGAAPLGLYTMAFMFVRLPGQIITGPLQYVLYAHLAPLRDDKAMLKKMFLLITRLLAIVLFPGIAMLAAADQAVFTLFLSEKWQPSGRLFEIAAPMAALSAVTSLRGTFMMVIGRTDIQVRSSIEFFFILLACFLVFVHFGIEWFVIGYTVATFAYFPRSLLIVLPYLDCTLREYVRLLILPAVISVISFFVYESIKATFQPGNWERLFIAGSLGLADILICAGLQYRLLLSEVNPLLAMFRKGGEVA